MTQTKLEIRKDEGENGSAFGAEVTGQRSEVSGNKAAHFRAMPNQQLDQLYLGNFPLRSTATPAA
jgi:hypothetical protein